MKWDLNLTQDSVDIEAKYDSIRERITIEADFLIEDISRYNLNQFISYLEHITGELKAHQDSLREAS